MPRNTAASERRSTQPAVTPESLLFHRIHALLHTVRSIAQYEDELCALMHAARTSHTPDEDLNAELGSLLDTMPAHEYADDLQHLRAALPAATKSRSSARVNRASSTRTVSAKRATAKRATAKRATAKKAIAKDAKAKKQPKASRRVSRSASIRTTARIAARSSTARRSTARK